MGKQQSGAAAQEAAHAARVAADVAREAAEAAARSAAQQPPGGPASSNVLADIGRLSYRALQARQQELMEQRQALADRRTALAQSYEAATGANREGIGARLQMLDNNIVKFEFEIAAVASQMAVKAGDRTEQPPPTNFGYSDDDIAGAVFGTFFGTVLVTVLLMRRFLRRRWGAPRKEVPDASASTPERLDRIEQAVDTIAVEIERVSENQRFMTRLMTETQLGASIAAVRGSTELAKAAVEAPSDG